MGRITKSSSSALKRVDGYWVVDSAAKADLFAVSFSAKWALPEEVDNEFTAVGEPLEPPSHFLVLRT
eukprot:12610712-Alexandrium_andersonii.AAC.1